LPLLVSAKAIVYIRACDPLARTKTSSDGALN
jgi:hypothetical protein